MKSIESSLSLMIFMALLLAACAPAKQAGPTTLPPIPTTQPPAAISTSTQTPEPTIAPSPTPGQPADLPTFDLLGQAGGNLSAVALDGELAYLALGPRLVVLDVSASDEPQELFRSEPYGYIASDLTLSGERLYWLSSSGRLLVFDLPSPTNPTLLSDLATPPGGQAVAVQGDRLYIATGFSPSRNSENALRIYDCRDPRNLVELGALALPNQAVDLAIDGERAYVTLWAGSLAVIDISDHARPVLLYTLVDLHGLSVQPPYLFAAGMENLVVYDLSSTDLPQPQVAWPIDREPRLNFVFAGAAYQDYLYLFDSSAFPCGSDVSQSCPVSFHVLDVADPAGPTSLSGPAENTEFDHVEWAQVQGERLYVRDYHGLSTLSLSDPARPTLLWRYAAGSTVMEAYDFTARDGWIYLGTNLRRHSLYVYELTDLARPRLSGPYAPSTATSGALSGETLYLSQGPDGLSVLDVSHPDLPQVIAHLDGSILPLSDDLRRPLSVVGDTLYASLDVTMGSGSLASLDVTDPTRPQETGNVDLGGAVHDLAPGPDRLYALAGEGLAVVDVSNPHSPQVIASLELPGASQLALSGDPSAGSGPPLAFVSSRSCLNPDNTGGLAMISLADPDHPALLGTPVDVPCGIIDVAAKDGLVFLAAGAAGVLGVDISDPSAPRLAYRFTTPFSVTRVVVDGERLYALDEQAGIYVLRLD